MKKRLQKLFGVDERGRPTLPNSRRQVLVGGIICLIIWPGLAALLVLSGELTTSEGLRAILSPWLVVTFLGLFLVGQALLADTEWPRFKKNRKATMTKERKK